MIKNALKKVKKLKVFRKVLKVIKISLGFSIIGFLLFLTIVYAYLTNRWRNAFTEKQMIAFAEEVNSAPKLPDKFLFIYDKMYPGRRHTGLHKEILCMSIDQFLFDLGNCHKSPYHRLYDGLLDRNEKEKREKKMGNQPFYTFSWGIKNYCSPEKALDYYMHDFLSTLKKHKKLSVYQKEIIHQDLDSLNLDDIIDCIIILENYYFSDKEKYPESYYKNKRYFLKKVLEQD